MSTSTANHASCGFAATAPTIADVLSGTGQLVAVIADPHRPDADDTVAISRPGVDYAEINDALHDWQDWAMITDDTVNLAEIRRRIRAAGLD